MTTNTEGEEEKDTSSSKNLRAAMIAAAISSAALAMAGGWLGNWGFFVAVIVGMLVIENVRRTSRLRSSIRVGLAIGLLIGCLVGLGNYAIADSPAPPSTYKTESEDGRYVFVMLSPMEEEQELRIWNEEFGAEISTIRRRYSQSGLYLADNATAPLWTVDWYAHTVSPFSDGVHVAREGPWAMSGQSEGVSFFANGKLLKTYSVSDLVFAVWAMPHTVSHFFWRKETGIDDEALSYYVVTMHRERIEFDARTGEIVDSYSPPKWIFMGLVLSLVAFISIWRSRRQRNTIQ